jgi:hypothetical protein
MSNRRVWECMEEEVQLRRLFQLAQLDKRSMINASSFYGKFGADQEGLLKEGLWKESTFLGAYKNAGRRNQSENPLIKRPEQTEKKSEIRQKA